MFQELPAFPCPRCHERAFTKRAVENDAPASSGTVLTHLHLCHACGENYLSTVHVGPDDVRTETWDYYLDRETSLRRIRRYEPSGPHRLVEQDPVFIVGTETVTEASWRAALETTRGATSLLLDEDPQLEPALSAFVERWLAWWSRTARPHATMSPMSPPTGLGSFHRRAA